MRAVLDEEFRAVLALVIQKGREQVDKLHVLLRARQFGNQGVQGADGVESLGRGAGAPHRRHPDAVDACLGQGGVDLGDEGAGGIADLFGSFAGAEVVAAGVEEDGLGRVGQHDAVGVVQHVGQSRAAETAVDHAMLRKILADIRPTPRIRPADEKDAALGRRRGGIGGFELFDRFLPTRGAAFDRRLAFPVRLAFRVRLPVPPQLRVRRVVRLRLLDRSACRPCLRRRRGSGATGFRASAAYRPPARAATTRSRGKEQSPQRTAATEGTTNQWKIAFQRARACARWNQTENRRHQ